MPRFLANSKLFSTLFGDFRIHQTFGSDEEIQFPPRPPTNTTFFYAGCKVGPSIMEVQYIKKRPQPPEQQPGTQEPPPPPAQEATSPPAAAAETAQEVPAPPPQQQPTEEAPLPQQSVEAPQPALQHPVQSETPLPLPADQDSAMPPVQSQVPEGSNSIVPRSALHIHFLLLLLGSAILFGNNWVAHFVRKL